MGIKINEILAALALKCIHLSSADSILSCNISELRPCPGDHQICVQTTSDIAECICVSGYTLIGKECLVPAPPSSHHLTYALVTIFTLLLLCGGLFLVIKRYNLIEYVRNRINLRRNNDVMYEDVMIGQDDPPLSL